MAQQHIPYQCRIVTGRIISELRQQLGNVSGMTPDAVVIDATMLPKPGPKRVQTVVRRLPGGSDLRYQATIDQESHELLEFSIARSRTREVRSSPENTGYKADTVMTKKPAKHACIDPPVALHRAATCIHRASRVIGSCCEYRVLPGVRNDAKGALAACGSSSPVVRKTHTCRSARRALYSWGGRALSQEIYATFGST